MHCIVVVFATVQSAGFDTEHKGWNLEVEAGARSYKKERERERSWGWSRGE